MYLISKHKLKEKFKFLEGEAFASSQKTNSKHKILFHKGEACTSPLSTNLRRNSDFSGKVRHLCCPKRQIQNIEFCFIRMRHMPELERKKNDIIFYNQE